MFGLQALSGTFLLRMNGGIRTEHATKRSDGARTEIASHIALW